MLCSGAWHQHDVTTADMYASGHGGGRGALHAGLELIRQALNVVAVALQRRHRDFGLDGRWDAYHLQQQGS